mgnify:CR=1 FL=1
MADVVHLGPHERMTPEQALAVASQEEWDDVIVCGFHKDDSSLVLRSSHMTREFGLWIIEHVKLKIMDRL